MKPRQMTAAAAALLFAASFATSLRAKDDGKAVAVHDATVEFAMRQPQPPGAGVPGSPDNVSTHFLSPEEVTITKGGTVTFVVNGGGHGIAIHEVDKQTTREDIAANLCDGNNHETGPGNESTDRIARSAVCNGTVVTPVMINGIAVNITGTNNLDYMITDGKGNLVIDSGFNVTIPTTPPTVLNNPRLDDMAHSNRLIATSGNSDGDTSNPPAIAGNRAGAFLTGAALTPAPAAGHRIQVQFPRTGRYLVICMNRAHSLNDHMFGFVNVVGDGGNQ